jgi:curved DNA-binding protein CbpA
MSPLAGIFGRRKLTLEQRMRLVRHAASRHSEGVRGNEIESELQTMGASADEAVAIATEGLAKFEEQLIREVPLPTSARAGVNYYFALGVTPRATMEQIRRAYRLKAKEVHPDHHHDAFGRQAWEDLMHLAGDAHKVLTDPVTRRAYDVYWLKRSRKVTASNATSKERRGDWETRYLWHMAQVGEMEELLGNLMRELVEVPAEAANVEPAVELLDFIEDYEDRVSRIKTATYTMPERYADLSEQVRAELQRKQRLVNRLREISVRLTPADGGGGPTEPSPLVAQSLEQLAEIRDAHHRFDVRVMQMAFSGSGGN